MSREEFKVSVVIPVYNAENFLRNAVESAVNINEVAEIILIEDNSPDNALKVANELQMEYKKVKVYQHPDKGNHGAGASRNLGIERAKYDYIAFLDADDYYLQERFKKDKELFMGNVDCDGVYNSVGTHFYSEDAERGFYDKGFGYQEILTLTDSVGPDELFSVLFNQHSKVTGQFCTDGITLKKEVFEKVGYFNNELKLRQDIHLWRRLAGFCNLYAGELLKPVAMRGIHENNRMTKVEDHEEYMDLYWNSLNDEFKRNKLERNKYRLFKQAYFNYLAKHPNKFKAVGSLFENVLTYPGVVRHPYGDFDFNFWKAFGRNWVTLHIISLKNRLLSSKKK